MVLSWGRGGRTAFEILLLLRSTDRTIGRAIRGAVEELGISTTQYLALEALDVRPGIHAAAMAREFGITRQSIHVAIRDLVRGDLVEVGPLDGGLRGIWLTSQGTRRLQLARQATAPMQLRFDAAIPADARAGLEERFIAAEHAARVPVPPWWAD